nr:hypothetical protein [uncultured Kingella sp.]
MASQRQPENHHPFSGCLCTIPRHPITPFQAAPIKQIRYNSTLSRIRRIALFPPIFTTEQ